MNDLDLKQILLILLERIEDLECKDTDKNTDLFKFLTKLDRRKEQNTYINKVLNNIKEGE